MQRVTPLGALLGGAPVLGAVGRVLVGRACGLGLVCGLVAGPVMAQASGADAAPAGAACTSARAVHDMRCPNYTGFQARLSLFRAPAGGASDAAADEHAGTAQTYRLGRDLQRGIASWYGPGFHGRTTANGEKFDMHELTAAHKTLPFGTRVLVHNPRTGKEVVVRINDRGPFVKGRVIDLSKAAAKALGIKSRGHDAVVLREAVPARELVAAGRDS